MTPPNPAPMTDHAGLVARLRVAAKECEREGVNGWGNSMADAADALEQAGGPCESCGESYMTATPTCRLAARACAVLGNGCRAWAARGEERR